MAFQKVDVLLGHLSNSNLRIWMSVAAGTVLFGLFGYVSDAVMTSFGVPDEVHAGMVGTVVGLGAGLGLWIVLAGLRERQERLTDEIQRVAELNHTVRNSLEVITWATHVPDERHKAVVLESTTRIEEKLRELFPVVCARGQSHKN
jgi:hypothetical protein